MGLCEDHECSVCLLPFTRRERIPRVLHCRHTFCDQCLETMSRKRGSRVTVRCPLCRRITCVGPDRSLKQALWVNATLWEQIADDIQEERAEGIRLRFLALFKLFLMSLRRSNRRGSTQAEQCLRLPNPDL